MRQEQVDDEQRRHQLHAGGETDQHTPWQDMAARNEVSDDEHREQQVDLSESERAAHRLEQQADGGRGEHDRPQPLVVESDRALRADRQQGKKNDATERTDHHQDAIDAEREQGQRREDHRRERGVGEIRSDVVQGLAVGVAAMRDGDAAVSIHVQVVGLVEARERRQPAEDDEEKNDSGRAGAAWFAGLPRRPKPPATRP